MGFSEHFVLSSVLSRLFESRYRRFTGFGWLFLPKIYRLCFLFPECEELVFCMSWGRAWVPV